MSPYLGLVLAYLAGSIPAAYIAGKLTRGIDLRQHGSGNLGATNVHRVLGAKIAVAVLIENGLARTAGAALTPAHFAEPLHARLYEMRCFPAISPQPSAIFLSSRQLAGAATDEYGAFANNGYPQRCHTYNGIQAMPAASYTAFVDGKHMPRIDISSASVNGLPMK